MLLDREYMPYKGWMNMKKRHVAIFVIAAIVAFGAGMGFGMWENKNVTHYEAKEPLPEESIAPVSLTTTPQPPPEETAAEPEGYLLRYVGDRTIAYKILPGGQLEVDFVANEVRIDSLPDQEREKLKEGIQFESREKLYGAIENYSS